MRRERQWLAPGQVERCRGRMDCCWGLRLSRAFQQANRPILKPHCHMVMSDILGKPMGQLDSQAPQFGQIIQLQETHS